MTATTDDKPRPAPAMWAEQPRHLAKNRAEAWAMLSWLLSFVLTVGVAVILFRNLELLPIEQAIVVGVVVVGPPLLAGIIYWVVYALQLLGLTSLVERATWVLEDVTGVDLDGDNSQGQSQGHFQRYAQQARYEERPTAQAIGDPTKPLEHFPVTPADVVSFVRWIDTQLDGKLNERTALADGGFQWSRKQGRSGRNLTQGQFRKMLKGLETWGYALKVDGSWELSDTWDRIGAHIKSRL